MPPLTRNSMLTQHKSSEMMFSAPSITFSTLAELMTRLGTIQPHQIPLALYSFMVSPKSINPIYHSDQKYHRAISPTINSQIMSPTSYNPLWKHSPLIYGTANTSSSSLSLSHHCLRMPSWSLLMSHHFTPTYLTKKAESLYCTT